MKISKALGVTDAGLKQLARAVATPDGRASGSGFGHESGGSRNRLLDAGLIERRDGYILYITDAGREIVRRARASLARLKEVYGLPLQVRACPCYPGHFDPQNVWFEDEEP